MNHLTRLAFRVQGGDLEAARELLVEACALQHAASFERAAKAFEGGSLVLTHLDQAVTTEDREAVRALLPSPVEAAAMLRVVDIDVAAVLRVGPSALVSVAAWMIEGCAAVSRFGAGDPFAGAELADVWGRVLRAFGERVEAPWLAVRVALSIEASKQGLIKAVIDAMFASCRGRSALVVQTALSVGEPPARGLLWERLLALYPERVETSAVCMLLDDAPAREAAVREILRRGRVAMPAVVPFAAAGSADTRRAVASVLGAIGDASAIAPLRQALSTELDARVRSSLSAAIERLSGAEPLVHRVRDEDGPVLRVRAALNAPRQPRRPAWLTVTKCADIAWRDGCALTESEVASLVARCTESQAFGGDRGAWLAEVRDALSPPAAWALYARLAADLAGGSGVRRFPPMLLDAIARLLDEEAFDKLCELIDGHLRASARERWEKTTEHANASEVELGWDPEALAACAQRGVYAWLLHWEETAPKGADQHRAGRLAQKVAQSIHLGEQPFVALRRFGLDAVGRRSFAGESSSQRLTVHVGPGGAIDVRDDAQHACIDTLAHDALGMHVSAYVRDLERALVSGRRTLAEAYAQKLELTADFVRTFLLSHPLWRALVHGCVVRRRDAPQSLRLVPEALVDVPSAVRLRFALAPVDSNF